MKKLTLTILTLFGMLIVFGQPPCLPTAGGIPAGNDAPGCNLCGPIYQGSTEGYTATAPFSDGFPCGTIENNQFISMVADSTQNISATILASNCQNNQGVQLVIYDTNFIPVSNCFSTGGINTPGNVQAHGLTPGETYWIMIDGFSGDICDILLTTSGGISLFPGPPDPPGPMTITPDTSPVCPGAVICYSIDPVIGMSDYEWVIPNNAIIASGGGPTDAKVCVEYTGPGGGVIRVTPSHPCFPGIPVVVPVVVLELQPELKPPEFVCPYEFPIERDGNIFSEPGNHDVIYKTELGCDSIVKYTLIPLIQDPVIIDTLICIGENFTVLGNNFTEEGTYYLTDPTPQINGCDSLIVLQLGVIDSTETLNIQCENLGDNIRLSWDERNFFNEYKYLIDGGSPITTSQGELILAKADLNSNFNFELLPLDGTGCKTGATNIQLDLSSLPVAEFSVPSRLCTNETYQFMPTGSYGANADFEWILDGPTISGKSFLETFEYTAGSQAATFDLTLTITENGCISSVSKTVQFEDHLQITTSDCAPDSGRVIFTFNSDPIADDYFVNVLTGQSGVLDLGMGTYTVSGLSIREFVEIEVIAVSDSICDSEPVRISCFETNCPDLEFTFPEYGPYCKDGNNEVEILEASIGDNSGIFRWFGPRVSNSSFDPDELFTGTNLISVTYEQLGCAYSDAFRVQVNATPDPNFTIPDSVCLNQPVRIDFTNPSNLSLMSSLSPGGIIQNSDPNNLIVSWNEPGWKTVSITAIKDSCQSGTVDRQIKVLETVPAPIVICLPSENDIFVNWNDVFQADSYEIYVNGSYIGTQTQSTFLVDALSPGFELNLLIQPISDDCQFEPAELTCRTKDSSGSSGFNNQKSVKILPNPTNGISQIISDFNLEGVEVFDPAGKKLKTQKFELNDKPTIDLSEVAAGIYFLKIHTDIGVVSKRVMKY